MIKPLALMLQASYVTIVKDYSQIMIQSPSKPPKNVSRRYEKCSSTFIFCYRDLRPASLDKGQEACRLRIYELYAWGGPLVISGIGAVLDNLPIDPMNPHEFIRPRFGVNRCFFYGEC